MAGALPIRRFLLRSPEPVVSLPWFFHRMLAADFSLDLSGLPRETHQGFDPRLQRPAAWDEHFSIGRFGSATSGLLCGSLPVQSHRITGRVGSFSTRANRSSSPPR